MKFVVLVTMSIANTYTALHFIKATFKKNYEVTLVFFYQEGVLISNNIYNPTQIEYNIQIEWQKLEKKHNLNLLVCTSSAIRRGIFLNNLRIGFHLGTIGSFVGACDIANKLIRF